MCKRNDQPKWSRQTMSKTVCRNSVIPPELEGYSLIIQIQQAIIDKQQATIAELQATAAEQKVTRDRLEREAEQQQATLVELLAVRDRLQRAVDQRQLQLARREERCRQAQKIKSQRMQEMIKYFIRDRRRYARRYARLRARFWPRGSQM